MTRARSRTHTRTNTFTSSNKIIIDLVFSFRIEIEFFFFFPGDFAVLIKAGMSAKQAVFYNLISSILCFVGMVLGIFIGDNPTSTSWVFAVSAGTFLYIGLVDMVRINQSINHVYLQNGCITN